jgi:hypothetical protein
MVRSQEEPFVDKSLFILTTLVFTGRPICLNILIRTNVTRFCEVMLLCKPIKQCQRDMSVGIGNTIQIF